MAYVMNVKILKEIAKTVDAYYEASQNFGQRAAGAFGNDKKNQIRSLENIAYSTSKISDIYDFIKNQTGKVKERNDTWRQGNFGADLLAKLESLKNDAGKIWKEISKNADDEMIRIIHLRLIKEFIKQLSAHYLYTRI